MKRVNRIKSKLAIAVPGVFFSVVVFPTAVYGDNPVKAGALAATSSGMPLNLFGVSGVFTIITNSMLFIVGALSVLMLMIGGVRYIISGGNSTSITKAKNTILYAIIGLIVSLTAYAIINFFLSSLISK